MAHQRWRQQFFGPTLSKSGKSSGGLRGNHRRPIVTVWRQCRSSVVSSSPEIASSWKRSAQRPKLKLFGRLVASASTKSIFTLKMVSLVKAYCWSGKQFSSSSAPLKIVFFIFKTTIGHWRPKNLMLFQSLNVKKIVYLATIGTTSYLILARQICL